QAALAAAGIPAVYTGGGDVFVADAAKHWLWLLDAFDQTHRAGLVRAAAATVFFGKTADDLADGGDALTDKVAETLRDWADQLRARTGRGLRGRTTRRHGPPVACRTGRRAHYDGPRPHRATAARRRPPRATYPAC